MNPYMRFRKIAEDNQPHEATVITNAEFVSGMYVVIRVDALDPIQLSFSHNSFKRKWAKIKESFASDGWTLLEERAEYEPKTV
jgi:hypothetical protein